MAPIVTAALYLFGVTGILVATRRSAPQAAPVAPAAPRVFQTLGVQVRPGQDFEADTTGVLSPEIAQQDPLRGPGQRFTAITLSPGNVVSPDFGSITARHGATGRMVTIPMFSVTRLF